MDKNIGFNIIDSPEWESVIEVLSHTEVQKHLNQWRHTYDIVILTCEPVFNADHHRLADTPAYKTHTYLSIMRRPRA